MAGQIDIRPPSGVPLEQLLSIVNSSGPAAGINSAFQGFGRGLDQAMQMQQLKAQKQALAQEKMKKDLINQLGQALQQPQELPVQGPQNAPMQGPQMPGMNPNAPQPGQPGTSLPNPRANLDPIFAQLYPEEFARNRMVSPLQQSEIAKNNAMAQKYLNPATSGKAIGIVYRNSQTGELTDDQAVATGPEWKAYKTTQGDVLGKLVNADSAKSKNSILNARNEAWNRAIDAKQIDALTKATGLTAKQQSALQNNNLRAARAVEILSQPAITWQELALGEIDLAGIMQGGVPQVDEVKDTHFPGWQQNWSKWKTYATGHPDESVPPEIKNKVLKLVRGVTEIDNRFIHANSKFSKRMLGPTIRGGAKQFEPAIDEMTNELTSGSSKKGAQDDPLGVL